MTPELADVTVSCLKFQSERRAHVFVSWLNPFKEQKLVVVGENKMAVFNDLSADEKLVLYNQRVALEEAQPILHKGDAQTIPIESAEPLRQECAHFLRCVETREKPLTDGQSGIAVLSVLEACQQSLRLNGKPVSLEN